MFIKRARSKRQVMIRYLELTFCCHHSNSHVDGVVRIYDGLREVSDTINELSAKKRSKSIHKSERKDVEYTKSRFSFNRDRG